MSASGCGLNRPLAVLHEGQLWVEIGHSDGEYLSERFSYYTF